MVVNQADPVITPADVREQQSRRIEELERSKARQDRDINALYAALSNANDRLNALEKSKQ